MKLTLVDPRTKFAEVPFQAAKERRHKLFKEKRDKKLKRKQKK